MESVQQPSPQPAQFSGQAHEWMQDVDGQWWQMDSDHGWWNRDTEGKWHYCATPEVAGILAATQGDAEPVEAQLQPQPQPQYGQTWGVKDSLVVDRNDWEDNNKWSLVGGDDGDDHALEFLENDSTNTGDSSSEGFGKLD